MTLLDELTKRMSLPLPGEDAHMIMSPLGRVKSSEAYAKSKNSRDSSVAIHIMEVDGEVTLLLIERSTYTGAHSGQISFPGGKVDSTDSDFVHTARRESWEETGVPLDAGKYIGTLTEVYIPVSGFRVVPHLFYHSTLTWDWHKNEREVAAIILYPIQELLNNASQVKTKITLDNGIVLNEVPAFHYLNYTIWGATAIILNELKVLLKEIPYF